MRRRPVLSLSLLGFAFIAAGCGGGGSSAAITPDTEIDAGTFHFAGQLNTPSITSSVGATVYALTGAITKATMADTSPTVEETEILTLRNSNLGVQIIGTTPDGQNPRVIATMGISGSFLAASSTWVYVLLSGAINRVPLAGGNLSIVKSGVTSFALSPDGSKIAYSTSTSDYRLCNADGSNDILMVNDPSHPYLLETWASPTTVMAIANNNVYSIPAAAGQVFTLRAIVSGITHFAINPTSHRAVSASSAELASYTMTAVFSLANIGTMGTGKQNRGVAIAPDGKTFATSLVDAIDPIYTLPINCSSLTALPTDYSVYAVAWTPYITSRQFLPAGSFSTGAAAVLYSENGLRVPNVVLADATTRTSMTAAKVSVDGATNTVYRLDCDQLTKLYYTKGLNYAQTAVVTSGTGLKGAYVSFDAASGQVSSVLTFTRQPAARQSGKQIELTGEGMQLFDTTGKRPMARGNRFVL